MRSSDFIWRILGHNSCLETNKESWSSQRLGGKKGNSSISPVFWFFTNFPTVQVHTDMLCVCPCLSPPALTAWSVHGLNSKDAFWEVYKYKHTPSCQVLGLCCQTIAFMSWGFLLIVSLQMHVAVFYSWLHYARIPCGRFSCCSTVWWEHQETITFFFFFLPCNRIGCRVVIPLWSRCGPEPLGIHCRGIWCLAVSRQRGP